MIHPDGKNQLRILKSERAGHAIPHPVQFELASTVEPTTGYRNQDVNSIEESWAFFSQFLESTRGN